MYKRLKKGADIMPIRIDDELPAKQNLEIENIFVMSKSRANMQDIRPLKIIILNLMPTKLETETQLLRLLSNSPLQLDIDFLQVKSHKAKNVSRIHMAKFYNTFDDIKDNKYDGMIITGAPVEQMDFEEVTYWDEITEIFDWARTHVTSTLYICWAAQAASRPCLPHWPSVTSSRPPPSTTSSPTRSATWTMCRTWAAPRT